MQLYRFKFFKITLFLWKSLNCSTFQIIISTIINKDIKILKSLSQAFTAYNANVFTLIPTFSEGRAGNAREHSNNKMLFLPQNKLYLTPPPQFSLWSFWRNKERFVNDEVYYSNFSFKKVFAQLTLGQIDANCNNRKQKLILKLFWRKICAKYLM